MSSVFMFHSPENTGTPVPRRRFDSKEKKSSKKSKPLKSNQIGESGSSSVAVSQVGGENSSRSSITAQHRSVSVPISQILINLPSNEKANLPFSEGGTSETSNHGKLDKHTASTSPAAVTPRQSHASSSTASPVSNSNTSSFATLPSAVIMTTDPSTSIAHFGTASDFIMRTLIMDFRAHTKKKLDDILKVGVVRHQQGTYHGFLCFGH